MRSALARLLLVAVVASAFAGCRPGSALHGRYNNFRAYYNTYYNASRSLEEGELALERAAVTVDRSRLVPVFPETASAGGTTGPFQEAIDKSAELLRNRPDSKWADDALLLIGKAYFYQRNLAGAEQKFRETMAASLVSEDRRLGDEARFWLGRTYAASDRFDEGVGVLEEGLADEGGDRRWTARMRLALGELYARAGRWDEAAETLRAGAPDEGDPDVAARAYVLLGQVEEQAERWDLAADAYQLALDRRPAYELTYASQVGRALVLGVDAGRTDEGLAVVRRMRGDDKNFDRRGELALIEARLLAAAGETQAAQRLFRDVLYDEELLTPEPVKGQAHYRLAEFYRDGMGDYIRASAHFDSAATRLRAPATALRASRDAILDVTDEARTYAVLASAARRIVDADSLLALGDLDEDAFRLRIADIEAERNRIYVQEQRRLSELRTAERFRGGEVVEGGGGQRQQRPGANSSSGAPASGSGGFLSYQDRASVLAGQIAFAQRWGDRSLVPGWRRRASIQASDIASARGTVSTSVQGGAGLAEGLPPLNLNAVPRTPAKRNQLITELSGLRYELANAFFLSLGRADTAAVLYRAILSETPDLPVAVRARYALAEIERAAGRDDVARPLYEAVAAADTSALGRSSRARLGQEPEEIGAGPVETSADYDAARVRWRNGDLLGGMEDMVQVGDARPEVETAPRAYLAAAAAYIQYAAADTLALTAFLPDSLVSRVLLAEAMDAAPPPTGDADPGRQLGGEARDGVPSPGALPERPSPAGTERPDPPVKRAPGMFTADVADDEESERGFGVVPALPPVAAAPEPRREVGNLAIPDSASFTIRHHLVAISTRYPGTPYAERAVLLAVALPIPIAPEPPPVADSTAIDSVSADSTGADAALADSAVAAAPRDADDDAPVDDAEPQARANADLTGLRGQEPFDPTDGGYTWRVQRVTIADEATSLVTVLQSAGFRVATLRDAERGDIVVVLGQFETAAQAEAVRTNLPAWAQIRGEVIPLEGLVPVSSGLPGAGDLE